MMKWAVKRGLNVRAVADTRVTFMARKKPPPFVERATLTHDAVLKIQERSIDEFRTSQAMLAPASSRPLNSRRVVVTGPRQYASKLIGLLVDAGAQPIWIPSVEISALEAPEDIRMLHNALRNLDAFTHIAFTSKNGIQAVLDHLNDLHGDAKAEVVEKSGVRLCALGADARVLEDEGLPVHILPNEPSTMGLVQELKAREEVAGARILCPVPQVGDGLEEPPVIPRFLAALADAGAEVCRVPAYVTRAGVSPDDAAAESALMSSGCVSAIVFTSTAEAQGLMRAVGGADVLQSIVTSKQICLAAHGPYTAAGVGDVTGLDVDVVGAAFGSFHGVVTALEEHFRGLPAPAARPAGARCAPSKAGMPVRR